MAAKVGSDLARASSPTMEAAAPAIMRGGHWDGGVFAAEAGDGAMVCCTRGACIGSQAALRAAPPPGTTRSSLLTPTEQAVGALPVSAHVGLGL